MELESDKIKQQIRELEQKYSELQAEREQHTKRIDEINKELKRIRPINSYEWGDLKRLTEKLKEALRLEEDSTKPLIVFTKQDWGIGKDFVMTRPPTPKRIYYRRKGTEGESYASKETGECVDGVIDIEKTLEAWSEYEKSIQAAKANN